MKKILLAALVLIPVNANAVLVKIDLGGVTSTFTQQGEVFGPRLDLSTRFDTRDLQGATFSFASRDGTVCMEDFHATFDATSASTVGNSPYLTGQTRVKLYGNPEGRPTCAGYFPLINVLPLDSDEGGMIFHLRSFLRYTIEDFTASQDPIWDWLQSVQGPGEAWGTVNGVPTTVENLDFIRITAIPEPATWAMFAAGLLVLLLAPRRRAPLP